MAALPKERMISGERAFYITGCDLFGPIFVTETLKKKHVGCIFVCFAARAVHLEVCHHMTCDAFLETFFDFFNSRGHATRHIWSNNETNLKAGSKAFTQSFENVKWKDVTDKWSAHGISWRHVPALGPSKKVFGNEWWDYGKI